MSDSAAPVFLFDGDDPEMQKAYENARSTFRYFWREVAWERRRIIPALDLAVVKAPFSDGPKADPKSKTPQVEQMWMSDIDFDGKIISGELMNEPQWLKTVNVQDAGRFPLNQITDWMYVINGDVYGAYTVNLIRSRMDAKERAQHDAAWGLNFGNPRQIRVVPDSYQKKSGGFLQKLFGKKQQSDIAEHPMSINMAPSLQDQLTKDPSAVSSADDRGWTYLHHEALAGNVSTVKVLLENGANAKAKTKQGQTPLQLAQAMHWDQVVELLRGK